MIDAAWTVGGSFEVKMAGTVYEFRVKGDVPDQLDELFDGASVTTETVVRAVIPDQAALHGLIEWIDGLGFELIDVRSAGRRTGGRSR
jgi:hypothetical protein